MGYPCVNNEERAKKKMKREWYVMIFVAVQLVIGLFFAVLGNLLYIPILMILGCVCCFVFCLYFYLLPLFQPSSSVPLPSAKDSDVLFYILSQNYGEIEVKVEERIWEKKKKKIPFFALVFVKENEEGEEEELFRGVLREKKKEGIEEVEVDLEKGILYIPCVPEEEKEEKE